MMVSNHASGGSGEAGNMSQPLSQSLAEILREDSAAAGLTLNRLLERTQGRGLFLVIILLCLPFIVPVSLPGLSTLMGSIILLLSLRLALGKSARLPAFLGERVLPRSVQQRAVGGSVKFLRWLEKFIRPRRTRWLGTRPAKLANIFFIAALSLLLALPLPTPPFFFSNSLPSYAIILIAASMMEEDGVLIWIAYAMVLANVVFFTLVGGAIAAAIAYGWEALLKHFSGQ
jgi:hypothetical protein